MIAIVPICFAIIYENSGRFVRSIPVKASDNKMEEPSGKQPADSIKLILQWLPKIDTVYKYLWAVK